MDIYQLIDAVRASDLQSARHCLTGGVDPNLFPQWATGPLHEAVISADIRIIEHLLFAGADPHLPDVWGLSALDYDHGT
jgi:ankyrin repeat protein